MGFATEMALSRAAMRAFFILVIASMATAVTAAETTTKWRHLTVLGSEMPLSSPDASPVWLLYYRYLHIHADAPDCDRQTVLTTSTLSSDVMSPCGVPIVARVFASWISNAAYKDYDDKGRLRQDEVVNGHALGTEITSSGPLRLSRWSATPSAELKRVFYDENTHGVRRRPSPWSPAHGQYSLKVVQEFKDLEQEDALGWIKNGYEVTLAAVQMWRPGYEGFADSGQPLRESQLLLGTARGYLRLPADHVADGAAKGIFQNKVDRNNALAVGGYVSDIDMPGYYHLQFKNHAAGKAEFGYGFPVARDFRVHVSSHYLWLAEDNLVTGAARLDRRFFRSVALATDAKLFHLLPIHAAYAYAIDARRGSEEKGAHSFFFYMIAAWGGP